MSLRKVESVVGFVYLKVLVQIGYPPSAYLLERFLNTRVVILGGVKDKIR